MASQMASLAFDAVVTTLTLFKAFRIRQDCGATSNPLIQTFLREGIDKISSSTYVDLPCPLSSGIFYFVLISIANLVRIFFPPCFDYSGC